MFEALYVSMQVCLLVPRFSRPVPQLWMITNLVVDYLLDRYGDWLHNLNQALLFSQNLQVYADVIHNKGAALENCWGFIDGTVMPMCRQMVSLQTSWVQLREEGMIVAYWQYQALCLNCNTCHFHQQVGNVCIFTQDTSSMPICMQRGTNSRTGSI